MTTPTTVPISPVEDIVADMRAGRIVILVDEEDRENEGDLVLAADHVTADGINFMARYGRGLICLAMTGAQVEKLHLPLMAAQNHAPHKTAFTVSIEAREGVKRVSRLRTERAPCRLRSMHPRARTILSPPAMSSR